MTGQRDIYDIPPHAHINHLAWPTPLSALCTFYTATNETFMEALPFYEAE